MNDEQKHKALTDPADVFASPDAVVDEPTLSRDEKIDILKRWEYDAREIMVADEEGLQAGTSIGLLDEVIAALKQLGAEPGDDAPTKQ